jgi:hypothetical protein
MRQKRLAGQGFLRHWRALPRAVSLRGKRARRERTPVQRQ